MKVDQKRKQVTLYDPSTVGHVSQTHRKMGVAAPKMFAFDTIFESDCSQVSALLNSFQANGHKLGFHPLIYKLEPPCTL